MIIKHESGSLQIIVLILLVIGILVGTFLVSQRTNLTPKARETKISEIKVKSGSDNFSFPLCSNQNPFEDIYEEIPEPTRNIPVKCSVDKTEAKVGEDVTWTAQIDSNLTKFTSSWQGSYPISVGNNLITTNEKIIKKTVKYSANGYKFGKITIKSGPSRSGKAICQGMVKVTGQSEPLADGLRAHYYNGGCLGNPKLTGGNARRVGGISQTGDITKAPYPVDAQINFDWAASAPKIGILPCFSVNWAGYIVPPETGEYIFSASVNDAARLWVDYKLIFNAWEKRDQEAEVTGTPIRLEASKRYDILLNYYNYQNNALIKLYWKKPNQQDKEIVPQQYLYSNNLSYCQMPQ